MTFSLCSLHTVVGSEDKILCTYVAHRNCVSVYECAAMLAN
jgi:hypothetical protein